MYLTMSIALHTHDTVEPDGKTLHLLMSSYFTNCMNCSVDFFSSVIFTYFSVFPYFFFLFYSQKWNMRKFLSFFYYFFIHKSEILGNSDQRKLKTSHSTKGPVVHQTTWDFLKRAKGKILSTLKNHHIQDQQ